MFLGQMLSCFLAVMGQWPRLETKRIFETQLGNAVPSDVKAVPSDADLGTRYSALCAARYFGYMDNGQSDFSTNFFLIYCHFDYMVNFIRTKPWTIYPKPGVLAF